ncbi:MAG TPA: hypothetical protein VGF86_16335 [Candidatus Tumulicola sp.]|jgi:predicted dinucleotide-binding enzyme
MDVTVVGKDPRAEAIGKLLTAGGYRVQFAGGAPAREGAPSSDVVLLAASRASVRDGSLRVAPDAILIDAMDGRATLESERALAEAAGSRRIVRALIVLPQAGANVLLCSDDPDAMLEIKNIFHRCGCVPTDRGPLTNLSELEPPNPVLDDQFDTLKDMNTVTDR